MKKIYKVTMVEGLDYNYGTKYYGEAYFSTKEKAEAYIAEYNACNADDDRYTAEITGTLDIDPTYAE